MKTIKEVEADIVKAKEELKFIRETEERKGENTVSAKIKIMRLAKNYLEFKQATKENILSQKEAVTKFLKIYEDRYTKWKDDPKRQNVIVDKKMFNDENEIDTKELTKWRSELKFLNYILS